MYNAKFRGFFVFFVWAIPLDNKTMHSIIHMHLLGACSLFKKKLPNFWTFLTEKRHDQKERMPVVIVRDHYSTVNNRHLAEPFCFSWYTIPLMPGAAEAGDPVDGSRAPRWVARLLDHARPHTLPHRPHRGRGEAAQPVPLQDCAHAQSGWRHRGKHQVNGTVLQNLRQFWKWYQSLA